MHSCSWPSANDLPAVEGLMLQEPEVGHKCTAALGPVQKDPPRMEQTKLSVPGGVLGAAQHLLKPVANLEPEDEGQGGSSLAPQEALYSQ